MVIKFYGIDIKIRRMKKASSKTLKISKFGKYIMLRRKNIILVKYNHVFIFILILSV